MHSQICTHTVGEPQMKLAQRDCVTSFFNLIWVLSSLICGLCEAEPDWLGWLRATDFRSIASSGATPLTFFHHNTCLQIIWAFSNQAQLETFLFCLVILPSIYTLWIRGVFPIPALLWPLAAREHQSQGGWSYQSKSQRTDKRHNAAWLHCLGMGGLDVLDHLAARCCIWGNWGPYHIVENPWRRGTTLSIVDCGPKVSVLPWTFLLNRWMCIFIFEKTYIHTSNVLTCKAQLRHRQPFVRYRDSGSGLVWPKDSLDNHFQQAA